MKSIRSAIGASNLFYDKKELSVPVIPTEIVRGTLRTSVPVWEEQTVCQTSIVRPRGAAITGGAFAAFTKRFLFFFIIFFVCTNHALGCVKGTRDCCLWGGSAGIATISTTE